MLPHSEFSRMFPNDINMPLFEFSRPIITRIQRIATTIVIEIDVRYFT